MGTSLRAVHKLIEEHEKEYKLEVPSHVLILAYKVYLKGLNDGKGCCEVEETKEDQDKTEV